MADRFNLLPLASEAPSSNAAQLRRLASERWVLVFNGTTNQTARWTLIAPVGLTGTITAVIWYTMETENSGDVDVDVLVEAVSDGASLNIATTSSFAAANSVNNTTVPGTAGYPDRITVNLTNDDGIAAGDLVRIQLTRDAASDTTTGNMFVYAVKIADGA